MELPLLLIAALLSLFVVFIGVFLALRAGGRRAKPTRAERSRDDGTIFLVAGADGGSRKGSQDKDGRDSDGRDGDASDGGGDGGGGGGD